MEQIVFKTQKGNAATNSRLIAKAFGKTHDNVLKAIDALEISPEFDDVNFYATSYTDKSNRQKRQVMMTRDGFARLVMGFTGKKAATFKEQYIEQFNAMEGELQQLRHEAPAVNLLEHVTREVQVANSKSINHHQYLIGGMPSIIAYNRLNCVLHTGSKPSEIKKQAKADGLPSKLRTSAKEVLRHTAPAKACAMSLADQLVRAGASLKDAAAITTQSEGVFAGLLQLGFRPTQLALR